MYRPNDLSSFYHYFITYYNSHFILKILRYVFVMRSVAKTTMVDDIDEEWNGFELVKNSFLFVQSWKSAYMEARSREVKHFKRACVMFRKKSK